MENDTIDFESCRTMFIIKEMSGLGVILDTALNAALHPIIH